MTLWAIIGVDVHTAMVYNGHRNDSMQFSNKYILQAQGRNMRSVLSMSLLVAQRA